MVTLRSKILALLYATRENWQLELAEPAHPETFIYSSFARHYRKSSLRQRLWEMVCRGELKKAVREGQKFWELTEKGKLAARQIPFFRYPRSWDGSWRLLALDLKQIPLRSRARLFRRLVLFSFGPWQKNLWLTPFAVSQDFSFFLEEEEFKERMVLWEARKVLGMAEKDVAAKVWPLARLGQSYAGLLKEWEEAQKSYGQSLEIIKKVAAALQERYITLVCQDPALPEALLPVNWPGPQVSKLLVEWAKVVY